MLFKRETSSRWVWIDIKRSCLRSLFKYELINSILTNKNLLILNRNNLTGKYIQDFTYINTANIKLSAEVVLKESSLDICSRECVNTDGFNCKSFDFCPESNTCLLNSGQQQLAANIPDAPIESCAHYRSILIKHTED